MGGTFIFKSHEELSVWSLQSQSSFRCLILMLFCFNRRVMCFLFFPREKKKWCTISWFISSGMLKGVNDFCYSDNLHMKSFVPKWDMYHLKEVDAYTCRMIDSWNLKADFGGTFGLLVTFVLGNMFTGWILCISTALDGSIQVFFQMDV